MVLSGNWRVTLLAAKGLKGDNASPTAIDFTMDARTVTIPITPEGSKKAAAAPAPAPTSDGELVRQRWKHMMIVGVLLAVAMVIIESWYLILPIM